MKLSLLGRARYLDRTTGRPCPPVRTTLFQPIAFVKRFPINGALPTGTAAIIAGSPPLSNAEHRSAE